MKLETILVTGFEGAIKGMRLPMCENLEGAYKKSDSDENYIGENDLNLCRKLINADKTGDGQPNSKFLRMIHVQVCITAPLYWWKEADTYKIATVSNSTSTMHKLASTPITRDCFETDDFNDLWVDDFVGGMYEHWSHHLAMLETLRQKYNETKDKRYWKELIRLLPESWLQTRMFDCDYATLRNIYKWRKNHKLTEWHKFCDWIETLPWASLLICN